MTAYRRETILWASLTLGAFALLPWERVGKAFLAWSWSSTGLTRVPTAWPLVAVGLAAALAVLVGTCGRGSRTAGGMLLAVSTLGVLRLAVPSGHRGPPFGLGGSVCLARPARVRGHRPGAGRLHARRRVRRRRAFSGRPAWCHLSSCCPSASCSRRASLIQGHLTLAGLRPIPDLSDLPPAPPPGAPHDPIRWGTGWSDPARRWSPSWSTA